MNNYRKILVHVNDSDRSSQVLSYATMMAENYGAALCAVYATPPLHIGAYVSPETAMMAVQLREEAENNRIVKAQNQVFQAAQASNLKIDFQRAGDDPIRALIAYARMADLVIVGQPVSQPSKDQTDGQSERFASQLLVAAACPIIFVPNTQTVASGAQRILVAWSGTRESARALKDALPFLQRAKTVEVLRFGIASVEEDEQLNGVAAYLQAHGVAATYSVKPVRHLSTSERLLTPTVVDASIAELLLSHAADTDTNLIIMGGYGHSRLFERVLGGVTRTLLGSMTVPVLMSH
jgi:nucleotide-binding universal stress UspA family protein